MADVLVIGGAGIVGSVAVRDLAAARAIDHITVGDINLQGAKAVTQLSGGDKASPLKLDVTDGADLRSAMKGCDVVLNGAWYEFNFDVMKAAMATGVDLVDFGGLYHMTLKQKTLDAEARAADVTVIPGCGEDPGITNVLAMRGSEAMDRVESIRIRDGDRDLKPGPVGFKFSTRTILDEFTMDAVVFEGGAMRTIPPLSRREVVLFPDPVGEVECFVTIHSELATLPQSIGKGVQNMDFMVSEPYDLFRILKDYGFLSTDPAPMGSSAVRPRDMTLAILSRFQARAGGRGEVEDATCVQVEVKGEEGGRPVRRTLYALAHSQPHGVSAMAYLTGVPASIGVQLLVGGRANGPGVVPPEKAFEAREFLDELRKRSVELGELRESPLV